MSNTQFTEIYEMFLAEAEDYGLVVMDSDTAEEFMYRLLINTIPRFDRCYKDLSNRTDTEFNLELNDLEKLILAVGMVVRWVTLSVNNAETFSLFLNSRNFKQDSKANRLDKLIKAQQNARNDFIELKRNYSYSHYFGDGERHG